jgi:hypothetical protein
MAYIYALSDTWNAAGTTFTGIGLNVTDSASAAGSLLMDLQTGGVSRFRVDKSGLITAGVFSTSAFGIAVSTTSIFGDALRIGSATGEVSVGTNAVFARDGANDTIAQRRGTNAQTFRVYQSFTDGSNFSRLAVGEIDGGGRFYIKTDNAGTGTARGINIRAATGQQVVLGFGTFDVYQFGASGFLFGIDNTYDIGAAGANRPRNLYMASWIRMATTTVASLPAAATAGAGARMFVTDASAPVFGSAVAGGGAVTVPVYSTGSAWNVG